MNPIVNLKWVKSHKQQKRTIYSVGKIESGLSYNLTKRLAEGVGKPARARRKPSS